MLATFVVFVVGVCVGSFTNVLIYRLPASESVVSPGSRCPRCGHALAWYENVPILSWMALGARCRSCRAPISVQYPLVELAGGLLFAGNFLLFAHPVSGEDPLTALTRPQWVPGAVFMMLLLAIAVTDLRTYLIPDELSLGGAVAGVLLSLLPGGVRPLDSLVGGLLGGGLLFAVAIVGGAVFKKEAMGGGDIKMLAMIGTFVGWKGVFLTLFMGALLGSIIYGPISLLARARATRARAAHARRGFAGEEGEESRDPFAAPEASGGPGEGAVEEVDRTLVPFGLFLAPAAALTYYLADDLVRGYLRLVGLEP